MAKTAFNLSDFLRPEDVSKSDTGAREQIEYIDIDLIDANESNFYELNDLQALADSIAMEGLQQPLVVMSSPAEPERVTLLSGHRRRAALYQLINDPESPRPDLRAVPCIRREYKSQAMAELQLILANSTARVLNPSEVMHQAERLEMLFYRLKEEGYEFPGRMRDHVAAACNASASKLARLKVIRERLEPAFMSVFESGALSEDAAYRIAQGMDAETQRLVIEVRTAGKRPKGLDLPAGVAERMAEGFRALAGPLPECPEGTCTAYESRRKHIAKITSSWDHVCGQCCLECLYHGSCSDACPQQAEKAKLAAEKRRRQQEELEKQQEKETSERRAENKDFAKKLVDMAGGDMERLADISWQYNKTAIDKALKGELDSYISHPSSWDAEMLADEFGVSLDYIYGRTDYPVPYEGEWREAAVELPIEGDFVFILTKEGDIFPSVFFRGRFMDYSAKSVANSELPSAEWWAPMPPLPKGRPFYGQETIKRMVKG